MKRAARLTRLALVLGVFTVVANAGPAAAATQASVGNCTVTPASPYITYSGGYRYATANIYVYCSRGRSGILNAQIRESDLGFDDEVTPIRAFDFTIQGGQTLKVGTVSGRCRNFDPVGDEELFTRAKINVGGINSAWAETVPVSKTC